MESSIQTSLCRSLSACGVPRKDVQELVNTLAKWYDSSGPHWTVERLKALKQWYISILAGTPSPPPWFRVSTSKTPIGIWGRIFKLKNPQKVLAILSSGTWFKEKTFSETQKAKFYDALRGSGMERKERNRPILIRMNEVSPKGLEGLCRHVESVGFKPIETPPDMSCISGKTIPVEKGKALHIASLTREQVDYAYLRSWRSIPDVLIRHLDESDHLDHIPLHLRTSYDGFSFKGDRYVGRISVIQEPEFKARVVANPNRIAQAYTQPLGEAWYKALKLLPTDCSYEQSKGVYWAQQKLREGVTLTGSDLSSASDLLDFKHCLLLVKGLLPHLHQIDGYNEDVTYFIRLSRGDWYTPWDSGSVKWQQGQPLGLYPSFAIMGLAHNAIAYLCARMAGLDPYDSFRIIGDDIVMNTKMQRNYDNYIAIIGGDVNLSKTVTSDRIAEFAGRIIEPDRVFRKTVKFSEPSDNSFMEVVSGLGPQSVSLLRPRQRKMWETFKYVPGIAVEGPYAQDSFGFPLEDRYDWYLNRSGIPKERLEPDPRLDSIEALLLRAYQLKDQGMSKEEVLNSIPWPIDDAYQASLVDSKPKELSKNPLLKDGLSHLEVLERVANSSEHTPFGVEPTSQVLEKVDDTTPLSRLDLEKDQIRRELKSLDGELDSLVPEEGLFSSVTLSEIHRINEEKVTVDKKTC